MYYFNCERVQANYRILKNRFDCKIYPSDIEKLKKYRDIYYNIFKYLESERALLTAKQYDNIYTYYTHIREDIKNKIKEIETKKIINRCKMLEYKIEIEPSAEISVICAIEQAIKGKEYFLETIKDITPLADFQKKEIQNLKNFLASLKNKQLMEVI